MAVQKNVGEGTQLLQKYWISGKKYFGKTDQFIKRYKNKIIVIKYGGYALTKPHLVKSFAKNVSLLNQLGMKIIIVHGGGPQIENLLKKKKIKDEEYQGLRVTTKQILTVVKKVLSSDLNKLISDEIKKYDSKIKRFDGIKENIINAKIAMNGNIGFVGEPRTINKAAIFNALEKNQIPVIAPLGYDSNKNILNINADTAAAFIAETMKAERLLLLTDVEGVMDNNKKLIAELDRKKAFQYIKKGTIKSGMIPKIKACFNTLKNGAKGVALIDGRKQNAVVTELLTTKGAGTLIKK